MDLAKQMDTSLEETNKLFQSIRTILRDQELSLLDFWENFKKEGYYIDELMIKKLRKRISKK